MIKNPIQPLIKDTHGVTRFKDNAIVRHLLNYANAKGHGLNELACIEFSDDDRQQLAQLIGYSLSGYAELSYVSDEAYDAAEMGSADLGTELNDLKADNAVKEHLTSLHHALINNQVIDYYGQDRRVMERITCSEPEALSHVFLLNYGERIVIKEPK